jgi:glycosyltransferase involved in cell wall biosynthesis
MQKKIIILPANYPIFRNDIAGIFIEDLNKAFSRHLKCNVTVIYNYFKSLKNLSFQYIFKYFSKNKTIKKNKINHYINYMISPYFNFIKLYLDQKLTIKALINYIRVNGKPDLIISQFSYPTANTAKIIYEKFNIPYIIIEHHTGFFTNLFSPYQIHKIQMAMLSAKKVIAVSHFLKNKLKKQFKLKNLKVIGNIIDFKTFFIEKKIKSKILRFTIVAALEEKKNIYNLLKIFNSLNSKNFDFRLNIVGVGTQYKKLYKYVKLNKLNQKIFFKHHLNRKNISKLFRYTDYLISCSKVETFGISICEGLASGIPLLVIDSGGPRDFLTKKNSIFVTDFKELKFQITKILQNKIKKFSRSYLRSTIKNKFSDKEIANKYSKIFSEITK